MLSDHPDQQNSTAIYSLLMCRYIQQQGKMKFIYIIAFVFMCVHKELAINIMPELKKNILNFGYGVNFKYEDMLSHSFDRFYVVTKFEIPKIKRIKVYNIFF